MADIKPFLHEHYLLFDKYNKEEASCCDECNRQIDDHDWALTCETCYFWLHSSCALPKLPHQISHPFHSQHGLLTLSHDYLKTKKICDKCFSLTVGYIYQCLDCDFKLDLICASSTSTNDHVDDHIHIHAPKIKEEISQLRSSNHSSKTIQHFSHQHPLVPLNYRKVGKDDYTCRWCEGLFLGMCYGCLDIFCDIEEIFFHESCLINMPTAISKHHFHPSHPLHLLRFNRSILDDRCNACTDYFGDDMYAYGCKKCKFNLHIGCVTFKPSIKHELHMHSLTYFRIKPSSIFRRRRRRRPGPGPSEVFLRCEICKMLCGNRAGEFNAFYRCVQCNFNLHLSNCSVPISTKHDCHRHELILTNSFIEDDSIEYYCDICEKERKPNHHVYYCNKCRFVAHIGCALNKGIYIDTEFDHCLTSSLLDSKVITRKDQEIMQRVSKFSTQDEINHFDHEHPLIFNKVIDHGDKNFQCEACRLEIFGEAYGCGNCKYYLHKACSQLWNEVLHSLHPQHSLKLFVSDGWEMPFPCYACNYLSDIGFAYVCFPCGFLLHFKCLQNTSSISKNDDNQRLKDQIESRCLFNQDHKLYFYDPSEQTRTCYFCWGIPKDNGSSYACFSCEYVVHEDCFEFTPREMQLQFHPQHPFKIHLISSNYRDRKKCLVCDGILSEFFKISYSCLHCDLHLHPYCAKSLKRVLKFKSHNLQYLHVKPRYTGEDECSKCKKITYYGRYYCMECKINLHIGCAQIPRSIKSKYHTHSLTINESFEGYFSEEYYCDICEEERDSREPVYYCTTCQESMVAHIDCVLTSVEDEIISEDDCSHRIEVPIEFSWD